MSKKSFERLLDIRKYAGPSQTLGIQDEIILDLLKTDANLNAAIDEACDAHAAWVKSSPEMRSMDEQELIAHLQEGYCNFYSPETVNPYVPLAARGPWIITTHGAILHDSGGYGMLGAGHGPEAVIDTMSQNWVMANIMTASFSQKRFLGLLKQEVGHRRAEGFPYEEIVCLNSGSEAVTVAARIADINAKQYTDEGGVHHGKAIKMLALSGAFHGRTDRPAQVSDSTMSIYRKHLATFRDRDNLITIEPNDIAQLRQAFADADANNVFIEAMFIEPVMGEGVPGRALERQFYDVARELTTTHGAMLIIDSIQAGFRGTGCLSITDYPGFEDSVAPDMESYSKALNAGQYPMSVLAMGANATQHYVRGVYGNTMTTNPRALEVASTVMESITPAVRENIQVRGAEFVTKLKELAKEFPGVITSVEGTGLLLCAELNPDLMKVVGFGGVEEYCRKHGVGVIHGGKNALRFTPHFNITSTEIDLIIVVVRAALKHYTGLKD